MPQRVSGRVGASCVLFDMTLTWFGWLYIVLQVLALVITIAEIGKPRKARTSADAIGTVFVASLMVAGAVLVGTTR